MTGALTRIVREPGPVAADPNKPITYRVTPEGVVAENVDESTQLSDEEERKKREEHDAKLIDTLAWIEW